MLDGNEISPPHSPIHVPHLHIPHRHHIHIPHLHTAAMIAAVKKKLKDAKDLAAKVAKDAKDLAVKKLKVGCPIHVLYTALVGIGLWFELCSMIINMRVDGY